MGVNNAAYNLLSTTTSDNNELMSSRTFKISETRASEIIDEKASIEQAIKKIIFTDRYRWPIYSSSYGIDLDQFIGKDLSYIEATLPDEIERALFYDDRVKSIQNLRIIKTSLDQCICTFVANTIFGKIRIEGEL